MPQRHYDPFASRARQLDATVNPYVAKLVEGSETGDLPIAFGEGLRGTAGTWRQRLADHYKSDTLPQRLIVEIGCHKGQTLIEMASEHPNDAFIGVDITFKRVVSTAERAKAHGLKNVYCVLANATNLHLIFAPGEIDATVIFFPDPWVRKKRQVKNRLVNETFCQNLIASTAAGGFCWFKTDQLVYFEEASQHFAATGFELVSDFDALLARDYSSTFERRFREQNLPTYGAKWGKGCRL